MSALEVPSPAASFGSSSPRRSEGENGELELLNLRAIHESLQTDYNLLKTKLADAEATVIAVVRQRDELRARQSPSTNLSAIDLTTTAENPRTSDARLRRTIQDLRDANDNLRTRNDKLEDSLAMQKGLKESLKAQLKNVRKEKDQEVMELQMQIKVLTINYDQLAAEDTRKGKKRMFTVADLKEMTQETEGEDRGTPTSRTTSADIGSGAAGNTNAVVNCDSDTDLDADIDGGAQLKSDGDVLLDFAATFPPTPIQVNVNTEEDDLPVAEITLVGPYEPSLLD